MDWACVACRCLRNERRSVKTFQQRDECSLTRLIQSEECTPFGQMPVPLHHACLNGFHFARRQRLRLMVAGCLIRGVISKLPKKKKKMFSKLK